MGRRGRATTIGLVVAVAAVVVWFQLARPPTSDESADGVGGIASAPLPSDRSPATAIGRSDAVSPPASAPTTTTTAPRPPPRSATLSFSGDVLLHSRVWREAAARADVDDPDGFDFRPMFAPVAERIAAADWAVCHLEVNLAADNSRLSSYPIFRGPGAIAVDLADVGFDSCTTASNHSLDGRTAATFETIEVLEAAGLRHTGTARSPEERALSPHVEINGIRIAHLAYTYWFNGFVLPDDEPWAANQIDEARILADAERARLDGAEFVIVSLHWGDQYRHEPNAQQADLGPRLLASADIDLIIGHHAHVVQPIERIDDEWLVYGVGNLVSNQTQLPRRDELIVDVTITETSDGSFEVERLAAMPVFLDLASFQIWPTGPTVIDPTTPPDLEPALVASYERVLAILETGSGWPELSVVGG